MRRERFEIHIEATPDDVWRMLTTAEGLAAWFGTEATIDFEIRGTRTVGWAGTSQFSAEITEIEDLKKLTLTYSNEGEIGAEEWLLTSDGKTTHLRLIHSMPDDGIDDWEGFYGDIRRGWTLFMRSLKYALEEAATESRQVAVAHPKTADREATWGQIVEIVASSADLLDGMSAALEIEPHSLLFTASDRTLLIDQEGTGDLQVIFIQASTFGGPDEWRSAVLDRFQHAAVS